MCHQRQAREKKATGVKRGKIDIRYFRPPLHYAGEIWKRSFHSENTSNVFHPQYAGEIWKRNSHRSFRICVWRRNHIIIVTSSFSKSSFSKCFQSIVIRKAVIFKFLQFEERFWKAPFSWRISVDGRPNRRNKAAFSNSSGVVWTVPQSLVLLFELNTNVNFCLSPEEPACLIVWPLNWKKMCSFCSLRPQNCKILDAFQEVHFNFCLKTWWTDTKALICKKCFSEWLCHKKLYRFILI